MRRLFGRLTGLIAILALLGCFAATNAVAAKDLAIDKVGVLDGVSYKIKVPKNWNKILLMYAHGYHRLDPPILVPLGVESVFGSTVEEGLLSKGYALAASSYRNGGWAVKEGIEDTKNLTKFFTMHVKKPKRTILWGSSMGSVVTLKSIEKYPNIYDGAIALSHIGAGTSRTFDMALSVALSYKVALGWPEFWGNVGNLRDNLDFETEVAPVLMTQVQEPTNFGKFEFIRLVNHLPSEGFYEGQVPFNLWLFGDMLFATCGRAELEARAGGPVAQNLNHIYTLTDDEKLHLAGLDVDADKLLSKMNKQTRIEADPLARNYLKEYADFSGELERPVLTIQPKGDGMTPPANSTVYRATVEASGASDFLVQTYTNGNMHVVFAPEQVYAAFEAMNYWLDTGNQPGDEFFPMEHGFDNSYVPSDWPQPAE